MNNLCWWRRPRPHWDKQYLLAPQRWNKKLNVLWQIRPLPTRLRRYVSGDCVVEIKWTEHEFWNMKSDIKWIQHLMVVWYFLFREIFLTDKTSANWNEKKCYRRRSKVNNASNWLEDWEFRHHIYMTGGEGIYHTEISNLFRHRKAEPWSWLLVWYEKSSLADKTSADL